MNKCLFKCDPKYIGNWYNTIIDNLETDNFKIQKSNYFVKISSGNINLLDIRKKKNKNIIGISDNDMIYNRIQAEKILHKLYLRSSDKCQNYKCSNVPITSLYITMEYVDNQWKLVCDSDEKSLGLCTTPIISFLGDKLYDAIEESKLLFDNACCHAIHIAWTFYYNNNKITHANTLLVNPKCNNSWLFEPQGSILNFNLQKSNALKTKINQIFREINNLSNISYKGYLTPNYNFQKDNYNLCYMWTTWIELLVVLNPYLTPQNISKYLDYRYKKLLKTQSLKKTMISFSIYIKEIIDEN